MSAVFLHRQIKYLEKLTVRRKYTSITHALQYPIQYFNDQRAIDMKLRHKSVPYKRGTPRDVWLGQLPPTVAKFICLTTNEHELI